MYNYSYIWLLSLFLCFVSKSYSFPFSPPLSSSCTTIPVKIFSLTNHRYNQEGSEYYLHLELKDKEGGLHLSSDSCKVTFADQINWKAKLTFKKRHVYLSVTSSSEDRQIIYDSLQQATLLNYTCTENQVTTKCYILKVTTSLAVQKDKGLKLKRSLDESESLIHTKSHSDNWMLIIMGVVMGVVLLTLAGAVCVKSSTFNEGELQPQSTGTLKILSGPPPEYFNPPPTQAITTTEEATINIGRETPSSPSTVSPSQERERSLTTSPDSGHQRRKMVTPLPEIPRLATVSTVTSPVRKVDLAKEEEDEGDESPYDYAKFDGSRNSNSLPATSRKGPPYAMVTRHSDTPPLPIGSYTEVRHMGGASRGRSVTEPVEPPPLSPLAPPLPRTYTEGASQLPLPLPPRDSRDENDDTYDSIENLTSGKLYDIVDEEQDEDDNEMYESVPEDFKEEILSSSAPTHSPLVKISDGSSNNSPSPTKIPHLGGEGTPDSPNRKKSKVHKESKRKSRGESTSNDEDKHKMSFFNRIRSSSTSAAANTSSPSGGKRDVRKAMSHDTASPDHHLPALPPLPPQPNFPGDPVNDEEDDEDDMYDSVRDKPYLLNSAPFSSSPRSATLPSNNRVGPFNPRINEPLPEVPEDSGSGSASLVVKRDRVRDKNDPNYDTVNAAQDHAHINNEEPVEDEPDYDTVQRREEGVVSGGGAPKGVHNYAKVTSHNVSDVSHDPLGYAVVDQSIVDRKRLGTQPKKENPYDKVKDPGYSSVTNVMGGASNSETTPILSHQKAASETPPTINKTYKEEEIADEAYAIIDPQIVQRKRAASINKMTTPIQLDVPLENDRDQTPSPAPPLPPVGDLGDLSEFEPPPIPEQPDDLTQEDDESPYAKVGGAKANDTPTHVEPHPPAEVTPDEPPYAKVGGAKTKEDTPTQFEPRPLAKVAPTRASILSSLSSEDGVPVYDSLDTTEQPLYDSLDPTTPTAPPTNNEEEEESEQQPIYDSLLPSNDDNDDNNELIL